jgi:TonB family protein
MKKTLLITLFLLCSFWVKAQTKPTTDVPDLDKIEIKEPIDSSQSTTDTKSVFTAVEIEPGFPGGIDRFYKYLEANIKYPYNSAKNRLQGKVFISFVVENDGSLSHIKVLRGVSPDIDEEAIRVMSHSPNWRPGIQNGRTVRVQYSLAINFKLPPPEVLKEQLMMDSLRNLSPDQKIFTAVEHEPEFKGGINAFYNFLRDNIHYPEKAKRNNIQGKVFISFVVEKDGRLTNLKIERGVSEDLDAEALRVIQASPNWNPGTQNGRPVRVAYTMPLSFALQRQ